MTRLEKIKAMAKGERIEVYLAGRLRLEQEEKALKEKQAQLKELMDGIEQVFLSEMTEDDAQNYKCDAGTAYKVVKTSVTTADKPMFLNFVEEKGLQHMLDIRPLKSTVEEYIEENGEVPPGLNMSRIAVVQIRKS